jgi:hypothetical protein
MWQGKTYYYSQFQAYFTIPILDSPPKSTKELGFQQKNSSPQLDCIVLGFIGPLSPLGPRHRILVYPQNPLRCACWVENFKTQSSTQKRSQQSFRPYNGRRLKD